MKKTAIELLKFSKGHWHVVALMPFMLIFFTVLHESAHALAVICQGGKVTEFVWLPTAGKWGHISYVFDNAETFSSVAISTAPYVMWLCICAIALLLAIRKKPLPYWLAGAVFAWMYVGPLADIGNTAAGWLRGSGNDFADAFGKATSLDLMLAAAAWLAFMIIGYFLQNRLYRDRALGVCAYAILCIVTSAMLAAVAGVTLF